MTMRQWMTVLQELLTMYEGVSNSAASDHSYKVVAKELFKLKALCSDENEGILPGYRAMIDDMYSPSLDIMEQIFGLVYDVSTKKQKVNA